MKVEPFDIEINQIYIADHLKHFRDDIFKSHTNLVPYNNIYQPSYFYGIFSKKDCDIIENNKSLIIWTGIDIDINIENKILNNRIKKNIERIRALTKVKHIAISKFIENNLIVKKIDYVRIPFMEIQLDKYEPVIKGNCIYVYTTPINGEKYGESIYSKLVEKYQNIRFIFTCSKDGYSMKKK